MGQDKTEQDRMRQDRRDRVGWDETGRDGTRRDGMGWDKTGQDGAARLAVRQAADSFGGASGESSRAPEPQMGCSVRVSHPETPQIPMHQHPTQLGSPTGLPQGHFATPPPRSTLSPLAPLPKTLLDAAQAAGIGCLTPSCPKAPQKTSTRAPR